MFLRSSIVSFIRLPPARTYGICRNNLHPRLDSTSCRETDRYQRKAALLDFLPALVRLG